MDAQSHPRVDARATPTAGVRWNAWASWAVIALLLAALPVQAALVAYTGRAAFDSAVAAMPGSTASLLDFDSLLANSLISSGAGAGGITFTYDLGNVSLQIRDGAPTTSSKNFLGTDDGGVLQQGDNLDLGFGAVNAIGLYVMSLDPLLDDDLRLTVGSFAVGLSTAAPQQTLSDGTLVYFLGLVDSTSTFTSASLRTDQNGSGQFLWNADDIVTAVAAPGPAHAPEPGTLALLGASLAAAVATRRRSRLLQHRSAVRSAGPSAALAEPVCSTRASRCSRTGP